MKLVFNGSRCQTSGVTYIKPLELARVSNVHKLGNRVLNVTTLSLAYEAAEVNSINVYNSI